MDIAHSSVKSTNCVDLQIKMVRCDDETMKDLPLQNKTFADELKGSSVNIEFRCSLPSSSGFSWYDHNSADVLIVFMSLCFLHFVIFGSCTIVLCIL